MLILSHTTAQPSHLVQTAIGPTPAFRFQNRFYIFQKNCHRLEEAIKICRAHLDSGLVSLVVTQPKHSEIWFPVAADQVISKL